MRRQPVQQLMRAVAVLRDGSAGCARGLAVVGPTEDGCWKLPSLPEAGLPDLTVQTCCCANVACVLQLAARGGVGLHPVATPPTNLRWAVLPPAAFAAQALQSGGAPAALRASRSCLRGA